MLPLPCGFLRIVAVPVLLLAFCPQSVTAEERAPRGGLALTIGPPILAELDGNGDGVKDQGETWGVRVAVTNGEPFTIFGAVATITAGGPSITVLNGTAVFAEIAPGATVDPRRTGQHLHPRRDVDGARHSHFQRDGRPRRHHALCHHRIRPRADGVGG